MFKTILQYRVVWGGDKLNAVCDDVIIVLHCDLLNSLKCAYEVDTLPLSKSRGRKMAAGFPRGEVLREVHECVSKSGVERCPNSPSLLSPMPILKGKII